MQSITRLSLARALGPTGEGRRCREAARLSLRDLADALAVSHATLARWESGDARPRPAAALRWADALESLTAAAASRPSANHPHR